MQASNGGGLPAQPVPLPSALLGAEAGHAPGPKHPALLPCGFQWGWQQGAPCDFGVWGRGREAGLYLHPLHPNRWLPESWLRLRLSTVQLLPSVAPIPGSSCHIMLTPHPTRPGAAKSSLVFLHPCLHRPGHPSIRCASVITLPSAAGTLPDPRTSIPYLSP